MKNKFKILAFITVSNSFLLAQNTIEEENGEVYIKQEQKYINRLNEMNDSSEDFNTTLDLKTYQERFRFLDFNTRLNIDYNDVTFAYVKKFLGYRWYPKIIGLSTYYFPLFESKLDKYGLPRELKYLSVVESALNPRAGSWVGATGLWQFMPPTGKQYGLTKNTYINTFYDPMSNSDAGARYLRDLYKYFGDWNLAISAYNCGQGNVNKAIRKAGTKNYWKLRQYLPKETQAYVPSFIAVNYIFNFYKENNMKPSYFKFNFFDLKIIKINKTTTFKELSANFDYRILKFANPQFLTETIPQGSIVYAR